MCIQWYDCQMHRIYLRYTSFTSDTLVLPQIKYFYLRIRYTIFTSGMLFLPQSGILFFKFYLRYTYSYVRYNIVYLRYNIWVSGCISSTCDRNLMFCHFKHYLLTYERFYRYWFTTRVFSFVPILRLSLLFSGAIVQCSCAVVFGSRPANISWSCKYTHYLAILHVRTCVSIFLLH